MMGLLFQNPSENGKGVAVWFFTLAEPFSGLTKIIIQSVTD